MTCVDMLRACSVLEPARAFSYEVDVSSSKKMRPNKKLRAPLPIHRKGALARRLLNFTTSTVPLMKEIVDLVRHFFGNAGDRLQVLHACA